MSSVLSQRTIDWGRTRYNDAFARQLALVEQRRADSIPDTLVLNEHEPVFTIGARPGADTHLVWTEELLKSRGVEVVKTNRGGDITYHGPGQIVGYPILSLREKKDLHGYLRDLEEVLIRTVAHFGLEAGRREGKTGIWLEDRKIAAIGVAVKTWVTYHGFALNVCPDLAFFTGIVPCGITDGSVTSIANELGREITLDEVKPAVTREFWAIFGARNADAPSAK